MTADWDEIKRLAADFQKIQLASTLQNLSERNCVEIVALLLEKQLVDVIFTNDGKEYITPDHFEREILDELYVNGGRVNLVELSKILNVDLSKVNSTADKLAEEHENIYLILGQLINDEYITNIAQEINEKLTQSGEISISDLTVQFDLPSDFLQKDVVEKNLGKIIRGRQDNINRRVFYTQGYVTRCKAKIKGALAGLTQPTPVASILQKINVQEKLFHAFWEDTSPDGNVVSKTSNAQYIPNIYAITQVEWVKSFFIQNGFLEYDAVGKLGITNPKAFIQNTLGNKDIIYLKQFAIGNKIYDLTLLSALNECSATKSFVDLATILPSNISDESIEELFNIIMQNYISGKFVYIDTTVFSNQYLSDLVQPCTEIVNANAKKAVENGEFQQYVAEKQVLSRPKDLDYDQDFKSDKRDERRKKATSGKGGGGTQGRETKTKSTKKHSRGSEKSGKGYDSDENDDYKTNKKLKTLELVSLAEIEKTLYPKLSEDGLEHLTRNIAQIYHLQFNQSAISTAEILFSTNPQTNRRQTHSSLQEKLNSILVDIRLYEKGLKLLPADVQQQLVKYILKTLGNDVCNELTIYAANECSLNLKNTNNLNIDQRNKIAQECADEYRNALIELNKASNKTLEEFLVATDVAMKACSMIIKKVDKKKDRILIFQHREKLILELNETEDAALVLHLAVLILFTTITGCILHASGRFVSQIIGFLQCSLSSEQNSLLIHFHDLVLKLLQTGVDSDEGKFIALEQLNSLKKSVKDFAVTFQKPGVCKAE